MLTSGQILDQRYEIDRLIASGGLANVYLAFDRRRQIPVVIKILYKGLTNHPEFALRFVREIRPLIDLVHPNIVRLYGFKQTEDLSFLVMNYVNGVTLTEMMKRRHGPLNLDEVTLALGQMGAALAYAHSEGVIHGDLKPNNLIFRDDGRIMLMDFGLAQAVGRAAERKPTGDAAYLSREQLRGEPPDARSDIYSLGALVYLMSTGREPFSGQELQLLQKERPLEKTQDSPALVNPCALNTELNEAICDVMMRAMADDPEVRWPDVASMVAAWEQAANRPSNAPTESTPSPPPPPPPSAPGATQASEEENPDGRRKLAWGAIAGVLLVGLLLLGFFGLRVERQTDAVPPPTSSQTVNSISQGAVPPTWTPTPTATPIPTKEPRPAVSAPASPTPLIQFTQTPIWTDSGIGQTSEVAPHTVWIIGDSITRGLFASSETAAFRNRLFDGLSTTFPGEIHTTFWETACTLRDLERLWDRWPGEPDLIFIEIGVNDIRDKSQESKRCPLIPKEAWPDRYGAMLDRIHEEAPEAQIVVGLIPWCGWDETHPKYQRALEYNAWIRTEAEKRRIIVADLWEATVGREDGISSPDETSVFPPYYHGDNFHPNDKGHERIADAFLSAYLKAVGLTKADAERNAAPTITATVQPGP